MREHCKIDHDAEGSIPKTLCRVCTPRTSAPSITRREIVMPEVTDEQKLRYVRKQKRRLRAEIKSFREEIEKINGRNPQATAILEDKLARAYSEFALADTE